MRKLLPQHIRADKPRVIKKRSLYTIKSNPFINGVANSLSFRSLLGEF